MKLVELEAKLLALNFKFEHSEYLDDEEIFKTYRHKEKRVNVIIDISLDSKTIQLIEIESDLAISFFPAGIIDTDDSDSRNGIFLNKKYFKLLDKVLNIVLNPQAAINHFIEFNEESIKFLQKVKRFEPILSKYNFGPPKSYSENQESYSKEFCIVFDRKGEGQPYEEVIFYFNNLAYNHYAVIEVYPNNTNESFNLNCNLKAFEKELVEQLEFSKNFMNLIK